jgi:hypothetical protein
MLIGSAAPLAAAVKRDYQAELQINGDFAAMRFMRTTVACQVKMSSRATRGRRIAVVMITQEIRP